MYSVQGYGAMITDRVRMEAYEAALRRAVTSEVNYIPAEAGSFDSD